VIIAEVVVGAVWNLFDWPSGRNSRNWPRKPGKAGRSHCDPGTSRYDLESPENRAIYDRYDRVS